MYILGIVDLFIDLCYHDGMKFINKTDIPDNVIRKRHELALSANDLEALLPYFLEDFCLYLKNGVAPSTRVAYLSDIHFFLTYLIFEHPDFKRYQKPSDIELEVFASLKSRDVNHFIGNYCAMYEKDGVLITNDVKSLARKRSSLSVMFKYLFVQEQIPNNLVDGFHPIKLPKLQPDAIKKLEVEEIPKLLELIDSGEGLTAKEKVFWSKTKLRDKAMIVLFITYGLRISELHQLDLASIHFDRNEFTIYRKRGKESKMPLNQSAVRCIREYIDKERGSLTEPCEALFLSLQKTRLTVRAIRDIVKKYTSHIIGGDGYSPHKLRATAASTMIEYGFSIYDVQNLLDHENVTTTQIYSAHRKHAKTDLVNQFELLNSKQGKEKPKSRKKGKDEEKLNEEMREKQ